MWKTEKKKKGSNISKEERKTKQEEKASEWEEKQGMRKKRLEKEM